MHCLQHIRYGVSATINSKCMTVLEGLKDNTRYDFDLLRSCGCTLDTMRDDTLASLLMCDTRDTCHNVGNCGQEESSRP